MPLAVVPLVPLGRLDSLVPLNSSKSAGAAGAARLLARAAADLTESLCREMVRFELVGEVVAGSAGGDRLRGRLGVAARLLGRYR